MADDLAARYAAGRRQGLVHHRRQGRHAGPGARRGRGAGARRRLEAGAARAVSGAWWRPGARSIRAKASATRRGASPRPGPSSPSPPAACRSPISARLKRHAGIATYTVVLQDPKTGPGTADLIWVPEHDRRRGANVITTLDLSAQFLARAVGRAQAIGAAADCSPAVAPRRRHPRRQERHLPLHGSRRRPLRRRRSSPSRASARASSSRRRGARTSACSPPRSAPPRARRASSGTAPATIPIRPFSPMPTASSSPPTAST